MCQAKPGLRCASDTSKDLSAAKQRLGDVLDRSPHDTEAVNTAITDVEHCQWDWDATEGGRKTMQNTMALKSTSQKDRAELRRRIDRGELMKSSRAAAVQAMPLGEPRDDEEGKARAELANAWNDHVYLLRRQQAALDSGKPDLAANLEKNVAQSEHELDDRYAAWGWPSPRHNRPGDHHTPYALCRSCGQFSGSAHRCQPDLTPPAIKARTVDGWNNADLDTRAAAAGTMALSGHQQCPTCGQFTGRAGHACPQTRVMDAYDGLAHFQSQDGDDEPGDGDRAEGPGAHTADPSSGEPESAAGLDPATITGVDGQPATVPANLYEPDPVLAARTPADIDGELADLMGKHHDSTARIDRSVEQMHRLVGDRYDRRTGWERSTDSVVDEVWEKARGGDTRADALHDNYLEEQNTLEKLELEHTRLEMEHLRRGGWSRAFVVTGGHVHSSMQCGTCRPTTRFHWATGYSGKSEDDIVDDAGERACTCCFRSAPTATLSQPTKMFTPDEVADREKRKQREAATAARKEKQRAAALTTDGSTFDVKWGDDSFDQESFKTETAATQWYVQETANRQLAEHPDTDSYAAQYRREEYERKRQALTDVVDAIAAKHNRPVEDVRAELDGKAAKKAAKEAKAARQPTAR